MTEPLDQRLGLPPFRARFPWLGGDLQTLRDSLRPPNLPPDPGEHLRIDLGGGEALMAFLERPPRTKPRGVALVLHGLGGDAGGVGPRRLATLLREEGFLVMRPNLRGAGAGRGLAHGSYAARCNSDLTPVLASARRLAGAVSQQSDPRGALPVFAAGFSLGGTILLNACLDPALAAEPGQPVLDALVALSSPLDLGACAGRMNRPRNRLYQAWLVRRLRRQVLADPGGVGERELPALRGPERVRTMREFDAAITAPRWGHPSVDAYYTAASPLPRLAAGAPLPPTLVLHAADDPWVPVADALRLGKIASRRGPGGLEVVVTAGGGHNGFHGVGDSSGATWSDRLTVRWFRQRACG